MHIDNGFGTCETSNVVLNATLCKLAVLEIGMYKKPPVYKFSCDKEGRGNLDSDIWHSQMAELSAISVGHTLPQGSSLAFVSVRG